MSFWSKYTHETVLLLSNAWLRCDAMLWMLKFSKPISSWCLQNVPCPSHFYLSKTVAAIPFDLDRKIHLLCFCANVNNTHHFSYIVLLILCVCVGACTKGGFYVRRRNAPNMENSKYIFSLVFDTNAHCLILSYVRYVEMLHCVHFNTKEMGVSMWQKQKIAHFIDRFCTAV